MSLTGRISIVTGAGSGIGRSICKVLSNDGAKVIAADINLSAAKETISGLSTESHSLEINVADSKSVANAVQESINKFKQPPSIVVNSAGITRDTYLLKMLEKDFDDVINVNLKGTFLITQHFAKAMIEHNIKNGSITNLSSIVAKLSNIGQANYSASKNGVISITEVASKEFGKFNIRVNAILPGYIETPMTAVVPEKIMQQVIAKCPLNRLGKPEDIANVVSFLSSDKAAYINGASIEVTGGLY
ncbi:hypothetical protein ACFFRR_002750 [Megaselia abdita]